MVDAIEFRSCHHFNEKFVMMLRPLWRFVSKRFGLTTILLWLAVPCYHVAMPCQIAFAQDKSEAADAWTDSSGAKTITADFVKLEGVSLTLRRPDGKEVTLPLSKLDDKSRLKARALAKNGGRLPGSVAKAGATVEFPSALTAQEFMDIILREINQKNAIVVWDALPASKQKQVQGVMKLATSKIEQRTLALVQKFRNELIATLKSKKQFILSSKALPIQPEQRAILTKSYDAGVGLIEAFLPLEWMDANYLQKTELRDLVNTFLVSVQAKSDALEKTLPPALQTMSQVPMAATVKNISSTEASIAMVVSGQPGPESKFVSTEGRWLPTELLDPWDSSIATANQTLQAVDPKQIHQMVGQGMFFANSLLGTISTAETQEDFDQAIEQVMSMARAGMGAGMGAGMPAPAR